MNKKKFISILITVFSLLAFVSCGWWFTNNNATLQIAVSMENCRSAYPEIPSVSDINFTLVADNGTPAERQTVYTADENGLYNFQIAPGTWTITVFGTDTNSSKDILTGSKQITVADSGKYIETIETYLTKTSTGKVTLTIDVTDTTITKLKIAGEGVPEVLKQEIECTESDGKKIITISAAEVNSGSYTAYLEFLNNDNYEIVAFPEVINVYDGLTTNKWQKNTYSPYINGDGEFILTKEVINKLRDSIYYVKGANGTLTETASDDNSGSWKKPLATVQKAIDLIQAREDVSREYTVYIDGSVYNTTAVIKAQTDLVIHFERYGESAVISSDSPTEKISNTNGVPVFKVNTGVTVTVTNVDFTSCYPSYGDNEYCDGIINNGKLILKNVNISNFKGMSYGGLTSAYTECTDVKISTCKNVYGNGGGVNNNGTFISNKGTTGTIIENCSALNGMKGGGFYNDDEGTVSGSNITITGCEASSEGGGIYNNGNITVENLKVKSCKAEQAAGIYNNAQSPKKIILSNLILNENVSSMNYGGIYNQGCISLNSAEIKNNKTTAEGASYCGGIHSAGTDSVLEVKGKIIIKENTIISNGKECEVNVYTKENGITVTGSLTEGSCIGVTLDYNPDDAGLESGKSFTSGFNTNNSGKSPLNYFTSDEGYMIALKNGEAAFVLSGGSIIKPSIKKSFSFAADKFSTGPIINWCDNKGEVMVIDLDNYAKPYTDRFTWKKFQLKNAMTDYTAEYLTQEDGSNAVTIKEGIPEGKYNLYVKGEYNGYEYSAVIVVTVKHAYKISGLETDKADIEKLVEGITEDYAYFNITGKVSDGVKIRKTLTPVLKKKNINAEIYISNCENSTGDGDLTLIGNTGYTGYKKIRFSKDFSVSPGGLSSVFNGCENILFEVDEGNSYYSTGSDGRSLVYSYADNKKSLVRGSLAEGSDSFTVPDGVTGLQSNSLGGFTNLKKVTLSSTVQSFPCTAFKDSGNLENIYGADNPEVWVDDAYSCSPADSSELASYIRANYNNYDSKIKVNQ